MFIDLIHLYGCEPRRGDMKLLTELGFRVIIVSINIWLLAEPADLVLVGLNLSKFK